MSEDRRRNTTLKNKIRIGVIGAGKCSGKIAGLAEKVGEEIGRRGAVLVCGGLGGVMEAACRGAKAQGGLTVGILPGSDPGDANAWVDISIPTGMGVARNVLVVRTADVVIAVDGAYGTLSEIGLALNTGIKVVGLQTWKLKQSSDDSREHIIEAATAGEAVEKALTLARK